MQQLILTATISSVQNGFSYERERIIAPDWDNLMLQLRSAMQRVSSENPDSVLVKLERPR